MSETTLLSNKKILFVEDDLFFSNIISKKLKSVGCILLNAPDGEQALATLEKEVPDVMLLDLMLPGTVDGFGVLENIKKNSSLKHIPVIILSNLSRTEDIEKGMQMGAFRYLTKALVFPAEIIENIELALGLKS